MDTSVSGCILCVTLNLGFRFGMYRFFSSSPQKITVVRSVQGDWKLTHFCLNATRVESPLLFGVRIYFSTSSTFQYKNTKQPNCEILVNFVFKVFDANTKKIGSCLFVWDSLHDGVYFDCDD